MQAIDIEITKKNIYKSLYLLSKIDLASKYTYSHLNYYYPLSKNMKTISFGRCKSNKIIDINSMTMKINQSYISSNDYKSKNRLLVKQMINKKEWILL